MNEMEHQLVDKTLESIHQLEMKIVELSGEIKSLREHNDDQHKAMSEKIEQSIKTDTDRLNTHSKEIDDHRERLATLEEWKKQFEEAIRNRLITSQSISSIAAVVIAYLLSKFL
ncbi:hypothetical protein C6499_22745 [Candidatus Poribacteria bacterium]|nr:MAG: hypothetical protein C6499_22745 [Candidatus Poribacteria bacterium]